MILIIIIDSANTLRKLIRHHLEVGSNSIRSTRDWEFIELINIIIKLFLFIIEHDTENRTQSVTASSKRLPLFAH